MEQDVAARLGRFAGTPLTYGARPTDWTLARVDAGHDGGEPVVAFAIESPYGAAVVPLRSEWCAGLDDADVLGEAILGALDERLFVSGMQRLD